MEYYLLLPGDDINNLNDDINKIGESSLEGTFWTYGGWQILQNIISSGYVDLKDIKILQGNGKYIELSELLTLMKRMKRLHQ